MTALATVPVMEGQMYPPERTGTSGWKSPYDEWTLDDLERLPDDGRRYEIIDGSLVMSPSPFVEHQRVANWLRRALERSIPPGLDVFENVGVLLTPDPLRYVIPDLTALRVPTDGSRDLRPYLPPADVHLAVEIVSRGSMTFDRVTKPALYAEAGIPRYWRVERSDTGVTVHVHALAGGGLKEIRIVRPGETAGLTDPRPITLTPPVWSTPPPSSVSVSAVGFPPADTDT
jgi:Uma2 family endonuclease